VAVARRVFAGEPGPVADAVALIAAAALAAHDGLSGDLTADLAGGLERARSALAGGAAGELVQRWVTVSQREAVAPPD
jgi:anthranilate phosphoribosyltransferase